MNSITRVRIGVLIGVLIVVIAAALWIALSKPPQHELPPQNAIMVIAPYQYQGTWVFDDPGVNLKREPFVAGIPAMIDDLTRDIGNAKGGFRLLFSAAPFPEYQKRLDRMPPRGGGGRFYSTEKPPREGWLCPALLKYFAEPPEHLYVKAEAISGR